jgi:hypothetical protein
MPTAEDADGASPMERKVVHWISQVPIIRDLGDDREVIAQFELGKYLGSEIRPIDTQTIELIFLSAFRSTADSTNLYWNLTGLNFISTRRCRLR